MSEEALTKEEKDMIRDIYLTELDDLVEAIQKNGCTRFTLGCALAAVAEKTYRATLSSKQTQP
jgi:hypothetical protein